MNNYFKNDGIKISLPDTKKIITVTNNRAQYYAELALKYRNEAKEMRDNAKYYAEQNSDVTLAYVDSVKNTLQNGIDHKQDKGDYALRSEIPTKISSFMNDKLYVEEEQLSEKLVVSNCYMTGEISSDINGLKQIKLMSKSTFDSEKFSIEGSASVLDGEVSGFSANCSVVTNFNFNPVNNWKIEGSFVTPAEDFDSAQVIVSTTEACPCSIKLSASMNLLMNITSHNGTYDIADSVESSNVLEYGTKYYYEWKFDGNSYLLKISRDLVSWSDEISVNNSSSMYTTAETKIRFGNSGLLNDNFQGCIDLKSIWISFDSDLVFNGNLEGTDNLEDELQIPYISSKTGSKIVLAKNRNKVQAMYEQYGVAPYYTLSELDFTLPIGEIYGLKADKIEVAEKLSRNDINEIMLWGLPDYSKGIVITQATSLNYTVPANGFINSVAQSNGAQKVYINDNLVWDRGSTQGTYGYSFTLPVSKNDVVKTQGLNTGASIYFFPLKGVN